TEFDESLDQPQGFNFEFWLKPASLNSDGTVAGRWDENLGKQFRISLFDNTLVVELMDDEGNHYEMRIRNFARIIGVRSGNQDGRDVSVTRLQNEHLEFEWTHLSLVADPANEGVQVYVNGFEARRAQLISEIQPSTARLEVGREFSGEIHEIRLWDRPRSSSEVRALKDLILSGSEDNLVLYHLFDEEDNERVARDSSPNDNNFTLSDEVKRNRSLRKNTTLVKINQNEGIIVRLSALDKTGGRLEAEVVKLPDNGRLFQLNPDLTRGVEISQAETFLTDEFNRFLYVPDENFTGSDNIRHRIFDQFGNFAESVLEFEVLKVNRPPSIRRIGELRFSQTDTLFVELDTLVTDNTYAPQDMDWEVELIDSRYAGKEDQLEQRPLVELDAESRRLMLTSTLLFIADDIQLSLKATDPEGLWGYREFLMTVRPLDEKPGRVYELKQNYPNPYNTSTRIEFWVPVQAEVVLKVYDLLGRKVATLVDQKNLPAGVHRLEWTSDNLASGIYFYRLEVLGSDGSRFVKTRKLSFIK
ncbi:MAG: LamG-like jellyroll fold domain-containing protein, partial [Balneolaceae bacterium]